LDVGETALVPRQEKSPDAPMGRHDGRPI